MEDRYIAYRFTLPRGAGEVALELRFEPHSFALRPRASEDPAPAWARLTFNQCANCPLSPRTHPLCPAAAHLAGIVPSFEPVVSFDRLDLEVVTPERTIRAETSAQQALSSLIGLVMATSGCPRTRAFRLMARFHLPLATEEETTFRATGAWLMQQAAAAARSSAGETTGEAAGEATGEATGVTGSRALDGLSEAYAHLRVVNLAMTRRLAAAGRSDATLNAVVLLDVFAMSVPSAIEDAFEAFGPLLE